jgi:translation initiation factor 3 subunit B
MAKKKDSEKGSHNNDGSKQDKSESNDEEPNFSDPEGFVDNLSDEGNLCT